MEIEDQKKEEDAGNVIVIDDEEEDVATQQPQDMEYVRYRSSVVGIRYYRVKPLRKYCGSKTVSFTYILYI